MRIFLIYYITHYLTSFPTYIEHEQRMAITINPARAQRIYQEALANGCDSVRVDTIYVWK